MDQRAGAALVMVPVITERHLRCAIETLHALKNLGEDAAQSVANRNHPRTIELGRLDVQHVVEAAIGKRLFEDIERGEFARLFDPQAALEQ
jgi:hypothetical protein